MATDRAPDGSYLREEDGLDEVAVGPAPDHIFRMGCVDVLQDALRAAVLQTASRKQFVRFEVMPRGRYALTDKKGTRYVIGFDIEEPASASVSAATNE